MVSPIKYTESYFIDLKAFSLISSFFINSSALVKFSFEALSIRSYVCEIFILPKGMWTFFKMFWPFTIDILVEYPATSITRADS